MKELKVKLATKEIFKKFGELVSPQDRERNAGDVYHDWFDKLGVIDVQGSVSVNIMKCRKRDFTLEKIEYHIRTPEAILPLGFPFVLAVAPAGDLDENAIEAFYIPSNCGVFLNTGVRHFMPFPLDKEISCIIVFRDGTGVDDLIFEDLVEPLNIIMDDSKTYGASV